MKRLLIFSSFTALLLLSVIITGCTDSNDDPNQPPVAVIGPNQTIAVDTVIQFDASASFDPDNGPDQLSFTWDFGDGHTGYGQSPTHQYSSIDSYMVSLTVSDGDASDTDHMVVTVSADPSMPDGHKWAIVIGIAHYPSQPDSPLHSVDDALDWQVYLEEKGYCVYSLIDSEAKKNKVLGAINWMRQNAQPGDSCAFIYSGHGVNYDDLGLSGTGSVLMVYDDYIFDHELGNTFADYPTANVFVFFNSCRAGDFDELYQPGRFIAESCGVNEYAFDGGDTLANSVFTYWFLEEGLIQNGYSSMEAAFQFAYSYCTGSPWYFHPEKYDGDPDQPYIL